MSKQPRAPQGGKVHKRANKFKLEGKYIAATYPSGDMTKEDCMNEILALQQDPQFPLPKISFICVSEEICPTTGNRHFHVAIILEDMVRTRRASFLDIRGIHGSYEKMKDKAQWIAYVKKEGNFIQMGVEPAQQRRMNMKERNKQILELGLQRAIEEGIVSLQAATRVGAGIEAYRLITSSERKVPEVLWFYGSTGTGKTRKARAIGGNDYWISGQDLRWFDGYTGQKVAILDDIRTNSCPFNFLLRLLDRYTLRAPIKGGFTNWNPEIIIVTCPVHPRQLYVNRETGEAWDHVDQLIRRVTAFRDFDEQPWGHYAEELIEQLDLEATEIPENENDGVITQAL